MFFDPATDTAFGNLGWVDHGSLWCWTSGRERKIPVPGARYVSVRNHDDGLLRLIHNGDESAASIRACANPEVELASVRRGSDGYEFHGDSMLWGRDLALLMSGAGRTDLLLIDGTSETVRLLDLSWFNADAYDLGYQGLVDCLAMPEAGVVVVGVQRSSELVLLDMARNARIGSIPLADRGGNPSLQRLSTTTIAASDYDVLCLVDVGSRRVTTSDILQVPTPSDTRQFIGDYQIGAGKGVVARPFSGDVVRFDAATLTVLERVPVPGQPLAVCMTSGDAFVCRDWKTGQVEVGQFG